MYLMIDNNDSFVYNLAAYIEELGHEIIVARADELPSKNLSYSDFAGIIISPGPGTPAQALLPLQVVREYLGKIPILGVCLGHQVIGHALGAVVAKGKTPMHGKVTAVKNNGSALFRDLPASFNVTRYHSLVIKKESLPATLRIDAQADDGEIMAISHQAEPVYGVQFHPEAVLTEYGHALLENFHCICLDWWNENA